MRLILDSLYVFKRQWMKGDRTRRILIYFTSAEMNFGKL